MCTIPMAVRGQKAALALLEPEVQIIVICYMATGNETWVLPQEQQGLLLFEQLLSLIDLTF